MTGRDVAAVASVLEGATEALVCAHVNPDGDAIGSVLGLVAALRSLGLRAQAILADDEPPPPAYEFLPGFGELLAPGGLAPTELFFALDTTDLARLGDAASLASQAATLVVIDHHPDDALYGHVNMVDPDAAATAQIIWRMLPALGVAPSPQIAECLYVGLLTDTGRFQYGNTDASVLRDAAEMVEAGARPEVAALNIYQSRSASSLELVGRVLARLTVVAQGHVAYSWYDDSDLAETGARPEEAEDLVDWVRMLKGSETVFLLKTRGETTRVSLRAKDGTDVGSIARSFGGGGHRAAAGFEFRGTREEALRALLPHLGG